MLEEIDESILGRTLTFRGEDGAVLALQAANRRLLCVTELPEGLVEGGAGLVTAPLGPEDEAAMAAVAGALRRFAAGRVALTVTSLPFARPVDPGMRGRSAAAVAQALGITLYDRPVPVAMPDPAQGFDAGLARLALAVAAVSGTRVERRDRAGCRGGGATDGAGARGARGADGRSRGGAGAVPPPAPAGHVAVFAARRPSDRAVVALLPADRAQMAVALWRATGGA